MNNLFGKTLRSLMDGAEVKERALAEALSYDTTYISKWLNGSKLPSPRNAESVIRQMAGFLARQKGRGDEQEQELFLVLKTAYDRDSSYISFQSYNNHKTSFLRGAAGGHRAAERCPDPDAPRRRAGHCHHRVL